MAVSLPGEQSSKVVHSKILSYAPEGRVSYLALVGFGAVLDFSRHVRFDPDGLVRDPLGVRRGFPDQRKTFAMNVSQIYDGTKGELMGDEITELVALQEQIARMRHFGALIADPARRAACLHITDALERRARELDQQLISRSIAEYPLSLSCGGLKPSATYS